MNKQALIQQIVKKKSFLCVGLDTDIEKIPDHLKKLDDPVFEFNKAIIDATADVAIAYKPNTAFYECLGTDGWKSLEKTVNYMHENYPDVFTIADAKRGDIGNTSNMYAKAFLERMNFDAITVAPYMGEDSVSPFLAIKNKWVVLLALTSNKGAYDFQFIVDNKGKALFEKVLEISQNWGSQENMMYVVGATKAENIKDIRRFIPHHFLLIPGIGAQGGSLPKVCEFGINEECGMLVNSSREIIYAGNSEQFAEAARNKALKLQQEMEIQLGLYGII